LRNNAQTQTKDIQTSLLLFLFLKSIASALGVGFTAFVLTPANQVATQSANQQQFTDITIFYFAAINKH
jgi:hypothetical protein